MRWESANWNCLNRLIIDEWRFNGKLDSFDNLVSIDSKLRNVNELKNWRKVNVKTWCKARRFERRLHEGQMLSFLNI
ncbi:MAG: hypothetical protein ACTS4V_01100 [Candidatus Hodgkinia cicadicola]